MTLFHRFWQDENGVLVIKFAVMLPVLLAASAYFYDISVHHNQKTRLQQAADAAALAVAKELSLSDPKTESLDTIAREAALALLEENGDRLRESVTLTSTVADDNLTVEIQASMRLETLSASFTTVDLPDVEVRSAARVVGSPNICVLGLNAHEQGTISLEQNARVTGQGCAVFSNSAHQRGLKSKNSATLTARMICTRGGKDGGPGNYAPEPTVNCPSFEDPLLSRFEPDVGFCDPSAPRVVTTKISLAPGTYCGLEIAAGGEVTLFRGVYVFLDRPLVVRDGGTLIGENAGLFFKGRSAYFTFEAG